MHLLDELLQPQPASGVQGWWRAGAVDRGHQLVEQVGEAGDRVGGPAHAVPPGAARTRRTRSPTGRRAAGMESVTVLRAPPAWVSPNCHRSGSSWCAQSTARIGPRAVSSRSSTCGPRSSSAPCSRPPAGAGVGAAEQRAGQPAGRADGVRAGRCGVGEPGEPGPHRSSWRSVSTSEESTPAARTASATARAADTVSASGFSQIRCRPAAAARIASSPWTRGGTANATTSTASNSCSRSAKACVPNRVASSAATAGPAGPEAGQPRPRVRAERGGRAPAAPTARHRPGRPAAGSTAPSCRRRELLASGYCRRVPPEPVVPRPAATVLLVRDHPIPPPVATRCRCSCNAGSPGWRSPAA